MPRHGRAARRVFSIGTETCFAPNELFSVLLQTNPPTYDYQNIALIFQGKRFLRNMDRVEERVAEERSPAHTWGKGEPRPQRDSAATLKRLRALNNDSEWV